jgi:hypothetical protein
MNQWGDHREVVVDVRPMTWARAARELEAFRQTNRLRGRAREGRGQAAARRYRVSAREASSAKRSR